MTQISLPITSRTATDDNLFSDVYGNDLAITNVVNGGLDGSNFTGGSIGSSHIGAGAVTDANLASPNNQTYKVLLTASAWVTGTGVVGGGNIDFFGNGGSLLLNNQDISLSATAPVPLMWDANALLGAVPNKTQKIRLAVTYASNSSGLATTVTFGLYPFNFVGTGAQDIKFQLASVVAGSTVEVTPDPQDFVTVYSADINLPTGGPFAIGMLEGGNGNNAHIGAVNVQLLTRNT